MIQGTVTADREAVIILAVIGSDGGARSVEAVIDTGFNGELTLPKEIAEALALPLVGNRRAELADGNSITLDVYFAKVRWGDQDREVLALQTDGGPLIGMSLLAGHRVVMDVVTGGELTISPLA
jgi:clan AA aspartic protease